MSAAATATHLSYADYVAAEGAASFKSEWINGSAYAMAGGTMLHARLSMAVGLALGLQLRGRPCVLYGSDLRVRSLFSEFSSCPDVTVVCGSPDTHGSDKRACTR